MDKQLTIFLNQLTKQICITIPTHSIHKSFLKYTIKENFNKTELHIFNIRGQKVKSFELPSQTETEIIWVATDDAGQKVASGIYFGVLIVDGKQKATRKMLLLK